MTRLPYVVAIMAAVVLSYLAYRRRPRPPKWGLWPGIFAVLALYGFLAALAPAGWDEPLVLLGICFAALSGYAWLDPARRGPSARARGTSGGAGGSVRGSARRSGLPLLKRAPRIPDPGQYVDLRTENGAWRKGFRTLSEPWTADTGEVMIRVATEDEYRAAAREGHSAVGMPWSTERLRLTSPRPRGTSHG